MKPLISVIIPCYRQARFLSECVASLQAQSYENWEAIIVDDGSPDDIDRVGSHLVEADNRVSLVRQANSGQATARNVGLRHARGDFIQFLDADDLLSSRKFDSHLKAARTLETNTITYTDYFHCDLENQGCRMDVSWLDCRFLLPRPLLDFSARWEHEFSIPIHAALFPKTLLDHIAPVFDAALPDHEDWDMWMRLSYAGAEFAFIPEELAIYRHGNHSMCRNRDQMWRGFKLAIDKQKRLLRSDKEATQCLRYLSYAIDYEYHKGLAKWFRAATNLGVFDLLPLHLSRLVAGSKPSMAKPKLLRDYL